MTDILTIAGWAQRGLCSTALLGATLALAACSSVPAQSTPPGAQQAQESLAQTPPERRTVASVGLAQVGAGYAANMAGPSQYDDTGLTYYAYRQNGRALPRSLQGQLDAGKPIELGDAAPGDLMFFRVDNTTGGQLVVGLLVDSRAAVIALPGAANQAGSVQKIDISSDYWQQRLVGVSRLLAAPGNRVN